MLAAAWLCVLLVPSGRALGVAASEEVDLGRRFALTARAELPLVPHVDVDRYVSRIGQRIVGALGEQPFTYQFAVVNDPRVNAFAVPGGYVYVYGGLLTRAGRDDEVAGVLGHEIAHVNGHHLIRQQDATKVLNYATLLGLLLSAVHPAIGATALATNASTQLAYRREFEQDADYAGVRYMRGAGYDPRGMLDFFKKMMDEQRLGPKSPPPYLLSHPLTETRLTNLEAVLHTQHWDRGPRRPPSLELERVQVLVRVYSEPAQDVLLYYQRRAAAQPADGRSRYLLGLACLETGDAESARTSFVAAQRLGFSDLDRDLGRALARLGETETARELLSRTAEEAPDDALAHFELGRLSEGAGDPAIAMREYELAVTAAPEFADAHYAYGLLAGRNGREGDGFYHLGVAAELQGAYPRALGLFEKALPLLTAGSEQAQAAYAAAEQLAVFLKQPAPHR
jgi:predicted Zn-dependent protease